MINELKKHDLNCNIFNVYNYHGLTMQELLCQFFTKINECVKLCNDTKTLTEWLVNQGLRQEVAEKLNTWLEDGTIEELINVNIFNDLKKEFLQREKISLIAQLDELKISDKITGTLELTELIDAEVEYIRCFNKYIDFIEGKVIPVHIPVTGIEVDEWNVSLNVGQSRKIIASVVPSDATNQNINFVSNNTSVATVSNNGVISAIKSGYAKVTATTEEGGYTYDIHVNVYGTLTETISNSYDTPITQQYSTSHEANPNNPSPASGSYNWNYNPRINPDGAFPQSHWNAIGNWITTYKVSGENYHDNVGLLLQNPKMWIWNTKTLSWDVLNDTFEYGTWYREDFWDDGNGDIYGTTQWEKGSNPNNSKYVKIKQTQETSGRCFHPWGYQKNWRNNPDWSNNGQPYIVTKIDFKLVKFDEHGVDNLDKAKLVVNSGADWWRNVGDTWQSDWSTNRDMAVGKFILATRELKRAWCTNLPENWSHGFPKEV